MATINDLRMYRQEIKINLSVCEIIVLIYFGFVQLRLDSLRSIILKSL